MKRTKEKDLVINISILLITIIIFLLVFEISLKIQYNKEHDERGFLLLNPGSCIVPSENKGLIHTNIPNKCGFNSKGYLDYEHNISKKNNILNNQLTGYSIADLSLNHILNNEVEGVFRIIIIGDSIAAGSGGIKSHENFARVLEKKLNNLSNNKFEVILLARDGYTTSQELILLQEEAFNYGPNLIIWSYSLTDPLNPKFYGRLNRYFFKPKIHFLHFITTKVFLINKKIMIGKCGRPSMDGGIWLHCAYWDEVKSNIKKIGQISSKREVPIIFLIHPHFERDKFVNYSLSELHQNLSREALKNSLMVLDVLDEYKNYNISELKQVNNEHPNAKGHEIIADLLYKKLVKKIND